MVMDSLKRIRDKSIPTTIPCPDSLPSYQRTRAALTIYIINRRRMAMDSLQRIKDKTIPTTTGQPWMHDGQIHYNNNALNWYIAISSTGLSFTYTLYYQKKKEANASLKRIRDNYTTIPYGWQRPDANESGPNSFQKSFLVLIQSHLIDGLELHLRSILSSEDEWQWIASNE